MKKSLPLIAVALLLSGCYSQAQVASHWLKKNANKASGGCAAEGYLKVGNPYSIKGIKYYPKKSSYGYDEVGIASWYGSDFHGKASANGECYDMYAMTAAHKTLPMPTTVRVTNLKNGRSVVLKVNDRGPYASGRIIDLSYAAAKKLDMARDGIQKVRVQAIGGPHHKPGGASQAVISASQKASSGQRKEITQQASVGKSSYSLTDRALDAVSARIAKTKTVKIGGMDVNANINESVSLRDIKDALPKTGSFTDRVSNKTSVSDNALTDDNDTAPTALSTRPLSIQFGSYSNHANAMAQWEHATKEFPTATLKTQNVNGTPVHRVRTTAFKNQADAHAALEKAHEAGFNNAVIVVE